MRIAYLLSWELSSQDGVTKKVFAQTRAWASQGHEVAIFCISKDKAPDNCPVTLYNFERKAGSNIFLEYKFIQDAYQHLFKSLKDYKPQIIYHRLEVYQGMLGKIMSKFPTVVELNSNELMEFKQISRNNLKGKIRYHYYRNIRTSYLSKAVGFCSVTNEIASLNCNTQFNKPTIVIPNSIDTDKFSIENEPKNKSALPRLVFMGSPNQAWHGVDKILELARYTEGKLEFDIIGPTKEVGIETPNVNFHGFLKQKDYEKVLKHCDIGICTMALHRNQMDEACPLKTREYLAYGLPIILGYKDTAFIDTSLPEWVLQLENIEENVRNNIAQIVSFARQFKSIRLSKSEVKKYIDVEGLERKRVNFLEQISNM